MRISGADRFRKILIAAAALCFAVTVFSGCSDKLSGTYRTSGSLSYTVTFEDDKITMSAFGVDAEGTYEISDGKITMTYTVFGITTSWSQTFEKRDSKTIVIGGTEFIKQ